MLERVLIPDNVLDRLARLEERLANLEAGAVTVQVVETPSGSGNALNGWLATGSAFQDLLGRIVLDASLPGIRLDSGGVIYSANYQTGVSGFKIDGGTAEFNNVVVRGTVYASLGQIGGWSIGASMLTGGNATLHGSGYLLLGTGNDVARLDAADTTYRLWVGNVTASNAPFRVTRGGALTATSANITGTINATAGTLGNLTVTGTLTVGASAPTIQISGSNKRIQSSNYSAGLAGFRINAGGDAEFNNVVLRGALRASAFLYGQILATGGTMIIAKATSRLYADCTTGSTFNVDVADPDGMSHSAAGGLWVVNDIIRLKDPAVGDTWAKITGKTDMTTYWRLSVSLQSGTSGVTFRAGTAVVNYGQSGQGVLWLTADDSNAPFYSVRTHAGSPWSAMTELARLGNLNGSWGYTSTIYGIALGEYASNKANLTWDPTNGLRLRTHNTTVLQLDNSGNATIAGVLNIGVNGGIYQGTGSFSNPQAGLKIWNDNGNGSIAVFSDSNMLLSLNADGPAIWSGEIYNPKAALRFFSYNAKVRPVGSSTPGKTEIAYISRVATAYTQSSYLNIVALPYEAFNNHYQWWEQHPGRVALVARNPDGTTFASIMLGEIEDGSGLDIAAPTAGKVRICNNLSIYGYITDSVPVGCRVYATTSQNIQHNTITALSFNTEAENVRNCWSSSSPTRLVVPVSGYYIFGGGWSLASNQNPGGFRVWVGALKNGAVRIAANEVHTVANKNVNISVTGSCYLAAGDYIEIYAFQDSGSTRPTNASPDWQHLVHGWLRRLA